MQTIAKCTDDRTGRIAGFIELELGPKEAWVLIFRDPVKDHPDCVGLMSAPWMGPEGTKLAILNVAKFLEDKELGQ